MFPPLSPPQHVYGFARHLMFAPPPPNIRTSHAFLVIPKSKIQQKPKNQKTKKNSPSPFLPPNQNQTRNRETDRWSAAYPPVKEVASGDVVHLWTVSGEPGRVPLAGVRSVSHTQRVTLARLDSSDI